VIFRPPCRLSGQHIQVLGAIGSKRLDLLAWQSGPHLR
jgi:hypothetical protein